MATATRPNLAQAAGHLLGMAKKMLAVGLRPVILYPKDFPRAKGPATGKEPFGKQWGIKPVSLKTIEADIRYFVEQDYLPGIGVCLGPGRAPGGAWLADIEGDGPGSEESRAKLFGNSPTPTQGWGSARGPHELWKIDGERMAEITTRLKPFQIKDANQPGVFHIPALSGLELRLGGYKNDGVIKQLQSAIPPTPGTDGAPRVWNDVKDIAEAPESFYQALEAIVEEAASSQQAKPVTWEMPVTRATTRPSGSGPANSAELWLQAALRNAVRRIESTQPGQRRDAYRDEAYDLAGYLHYNLGYTESELCQTLENARAIGVQLGDPKVAETVREAIEAGKAAPHNLPKQDLHEAAIGIRRPSLARHPTVELPTLEPIDPGPLRAAAAAFTSFADLLRDKDFKLNLAKLELDDPSEASAIVATLDESLKSKFKARQFHAAMARARDQAKLEAYGEETLPQLFGEAIDDPHRLVRIFLAENCSSMDGRTLVYHREEFYLHEGTCYKLYKDVSEDLTSSIKQEFDSQHAKALIAYAMGKKAGTAKEEDAPKLLKVTASVLKNALLALKSETALAWEQSPPCWVGDHDGAWVDRNPLDILATKNTLVHLPTLETLSHTPRLFTPYSLNYSWVNRPPKPERWNRFVGEELWPDDDESVRELQKWFGLALTLITMYQKILMLIGPPGSGKGTILRVLTMMVGGHNVANPSLPGLARPFGLWPLLDKSLCVFSDAHALGSPSDRAIVLEMLLKISGEDAVTVDRKYQQPLTTKLNTRLIFIGNQEPNFRDPSGALMRRIAPLQLRNSFKGKENQNLTATLIEELPGILRYFAVEGLEMLKEDRGFKTPKSAEKLLSRMNEILSPAATFVDECIDVVEPDDADVAYLPLKKDVFSAYVGWCKETKHEPGSTGVFGRNLRAVPMLSHLEDERDSSGAREWRYRGIRLNSQGQKYANSLIWSMSVGRGES